MCFVGISALLNAGSLTSWWRKHVKSPFFFAIIRLHCKKILSCFPVFFSCLGSPITSSQCNWVSTDGHLQPFGPLSSSGPAADCHHTGCHPKIPSPYAAKSSRQKPARPAALLRGAVQTAQLGARWVRDTARNGDPIPTSGRAFDGSRVRTGASAARHRRIGGRRGRKATVSSPILPSRRLAGAAAPWRLLRRAAVYNRGQRPAGRGCGHVFCHHGAVNWLFPQVNVGAQDVSGIRSGLGYQGPENYEEYSRSWEIYEIESDTGVKRVTVTREEIDPAAWMWRWKKVQGTITLDGRIVYEWRNPSGVVYQPGSSVFRELRKVTRRTFRRPGDASWTMTEIETAVTGGDTRFLRHFLHWGKPVTRWVILYDVNHTRDSLMLFRCMHCTEYRQI